MLLTKIKQHCLAFLPATLWAGIIFLFSAQEMLPSLTLSVLDFLFKKSAHMFVYAVLYFLLYQTFKQLGTKTKNIWKKALIISLIYALTDEFHQSLVPGRSATLRDVGFDFLGISLIILRKFKYI